MDRGRAQSSDLAPRKVHPMTLQAVGDPYCNHRVYSHYRQNLDRYRAGGVTTEINQTHPICRRRRSFDSEGDRPGAADAVSPGTFENQDDEEECAKSREGLPPTIGGIDAHSSYVSPSPVESKSSEGTSRSVADGPTTPCSRPSTADPKPTTAPRCSPDVDS